jgi:flagellar biosynthesis/type III secretory pathway protein FliH
MTLEQALQRPTAAVLAGALHGYRGNLDAARIAIIAIRNLPKRQRDNYTRTILAAVPKRLHTQLKKELPVRQQDELLEIEMQSGTYHLGLRAGRKEGLARGLERGLERGRKAGLEQARRTLINLILTVLEARDVAVDRTSKARIRRAAFPTLERWASAVRGVTQVSELFDLEDNP